MQHKIKIIMSDIDEELLIENKRNKKDYIVKFNDLGDLILIMTK